MFLTWMAVGARSKIREGDLPLAMGIAASLELEGAPPIYTHNRGGSSSVMYLNRRISIQKSC